MLRPQLPEVQEDGRGHGHVQLRDQRHGRQRLITKTSDRVQNFGQVPEEDMEVVQCARRGLDRFTATVINASAKMSE